MYFESNLIYDFILENELCTEAEVDMACDVGGFNQETLNYVIYRQTGYHDIEQLWDCEKEGFYFNDKITDILKGDEEDEDEEYPEYIVEVNKKGYGVMNDEDVFEFDNEEDAKAQYNELKKNLKSDQFVVLSKHIGTTGEYAYAVILDSGDEEE